MGMYTEINFRATLKKDTPEEVLGILEHIAKTFSVTQPTTLPDHEFFKCPRWNRLSGASAYFPSIQRSALVRAHPSRTWEDTEVAIHGNLKDYDGEIEKFFDWIDPYIDAPQGIYLGYSLYEENQFEDEGGPRLFYKKGEA